MKQGGNVIQFYKKLQCEMGKVVNKDLPFHERLQACRTIDAVFGFSQTPPDNVEDVAENFRESIPELTAL